MSEQSSHRGNVGPSSPKMDIPARRPTDQVFSDTPHSKTFLLTFELLFEYAYVLNPSQAFAPLVKELNEKRGRRRPIDIADVMGGHV